MSHRVLFLAPYPPRLDALHGGGQVVARLLRGLSERHRVALVYLRERAEQSLDEATRSACEVVEEVSLGRPRSTFRRRATRIAKLWGAPPDRVARVRSVSFGERVRRVADQWRPDIVQVEFVEMAQYLPALDGVPASRIVVDHDPGADAAGDFTLAATGLRRLSRRLDVLAWERFSRTALRRADRVVVFTDRDRIGVERVAPGAAVETIPIAVDLPAEPLDPVGIDPPTVLFYGSFLHPPNADAAERLLRTIMPCVRADHPEARLELVGADPTEEMTRLARDGDLILGAVPSMTPHLDGASLVVAPIRLGGGMRVKVLEALAAGKAVVASTRAVEGVGVADGDQLLIADTDEELCAAISALLADPARRQELAHRARSWAERNLDPARVVAAYERLYEELRPGSE
jgi:glycosyltransferase involved in cell wall biosynthesis